MCNVITLAKAESRPHSPCTPMSYAASLMGGRPTPSKKGDAIAHRGMRGVSEDFVIKCTCLHADGRSDHYELHKGQALELDEDAELTITNAQELRELRAQFDALKKKEDPNWLSLEELLARNAYA